MKAIHASDFRLTPLNVGIIPVEWNALKIGQIASRVTNGYVGPVLEHQTTSASDKVRYLQGFNIRPNRIELINECYVSSEFDRAHPKSRLQENDILTVQSGHIGTTARVPKHLEGSNCHALIITRPRSELIDARYLTAYLNSHIGQARMRGLHVGSSIVHINTSELADFRVPVPPLPEQRKIAEILSTWDEALEKLDALIEAKESSKKALMQQLLSRAAAKSGRTHSRHRLGEVVERVTRKNTVQNDRVLTISAQGGLVDQREYFSRNVAGADLSGYYLLKNGEFAYNRSSSKGYPFGALKRLDQYDAGVVSTLYLCFRIKLDAPVSSDYLCHYFEGGRLNFGLRSIAKEGARAHGLLNVTADEFFDLDIFLPSLADQQKIAAILDTADQELLLLRNQRTALDQQKRGMMQRLLTGKVRVAV